MRYFLIILFFVFPVQAKCVAHWRMNDNLADTDVVDSAGGYESIFTTADTCDVDTIGVVSGALDFNGGLDYIDVNYSFESVFQSDFSMGLWVKPDDGQPGGTDYLLGIYCSDLPDDLVSIVINTTGSISMRYAADNNEGIVNSSIVLSNGQESWHFIATTLSQKGSDVIIDIYFDSELQNTATISPCIMANYECSFNFFIGAESVKGVPTSRYAGLIDNITLWDEALTEAKIKRLYNNGSGTEMLAEIDNNHRGSRRMRYE